MVGQSGKSAFMDGFIGTSVVRECTITVIVEYIPVSHSPDALS